MMKTALRQNRKRGRPRRDDRTIRQDETIARTVHQLSFWGFSVRREGLELVGKLAAKVLKRTDHKGLALSDERIEQIYEQWRASLPVGARYQRARYTKDTLQERVPDKTASLAKLTRVLLTNGGKWPADPSGPFVPHGDPELTRKAHAEYVQIASIFQRQNGVIK